MGNQSKPNVLIFLCDQLRIDLLTCYQETLVRTPQHHRPGQRLLPL